MRSLAENLTPPYYAAILNEFQGRPEDQDLVAPAEEMVTLATRQPGFLGLETAHHENGERVMVSYWRDIDALESGLARRAGGFSRLAPETVKDQKPAALPSGRPILRDAPLLGMRPSCRALPKHEGHRQGPIPPLVLRGPVFFVL